LRATWLVLFGLIQLADRLIAERLRESHLVRRHAGRIWAMASSASFVFFWFARTARGPPGLLLVAAEFDRAAEVFLRFSSLF